MIFKIDGSPIPHSLREKNQVSLNFVHQEKDKPMVQKMPKRTLRLGQSMVLSACDTPTTHVANFDLLRVNEYDGEGESENENFPPNVFDAT